MTKQRPTILLTGFEPFTTGQGLVLDENPTAHIVQRVAATSDHIHAAVLPVSYARTPMVLSELFRETRPTFWLGLGYAPHRTQVDIEALAINVAHAERGDNDGNQPCNQEIVSGGPAAYRPPISHSNHLAFFREQGLQARTSFHAGTFLCNLVFYMGCQQWAEGALQKALFIHVPPLNEYQRFESGLSLLLESWLSQT